MLEFNFLRFYILEKRLLCQTIQVSCKMSHTFSWKTFNFTANLIIKFSLLESHSQSISIHKEGWTGGNYSLVFSELEY